MKQVTKIALVLACTLLLGACVRIPLGDAAPAPEPAGAKDDHRPKTAAETRMPKAGVHRLPSGRMQALGVLRRDAGEWVLIWPGGGTVAVLVSRPRGDVKGADRRYDRFVVAEGVRVPARPDFPTPVIEVQTLHSVQVPEWRAGRGYLDGVPPRWARVEKPGVFPLPKKRVRVVGSFEFRESAGRWEVVGEMPFLRHGGKVLAVVEPGSASPKQDTAPYGAMVGRVVGHVGTGKRRVPVVKAESFEVVTKMRPTSFEKVR